MREMADKAAFYFEEPLQYDEKAAKKFLIADNLEVLQMISAAVEGAADFTQEALEPGFQKIMDETGIKFGKIAQPLRVAITGRTESPGIFETMIVLGKPEVVKRLAAAIDYIKTA
jgi:glutamyl-tRNA synthetase